MLFVKVELLLLNLPSRACSLLCSRARPWYWPWQSGRESGRAMNCSWHSAPSTHPCRSSAPSRNTDAAKHPCVQSHNKLHPSQIQLHRDQSPSNWLPGKFLHHRLPLFFVSGPPARSSFHVSQPQAHSVFLGALGKSGQVSAQFGDAETRASMLGLYPTPGLMHSCACCWSRSGPSRKGVSRKTTVGKVQVPLCPEALAPGSSFLQQLFPTIPSTIQHSAYTLFLYQQHYLFSRELHNLYL